MNAWVVVFVPVTRAGVYVSILVALCDTATLSIHPIQLSEELGVPLGPMVTSFKLTSTVVLVLFIASTPLT